jgi:5'-3' exonuclease
MGIRTLTSFALNHATTKTYPFSFLKNKTVAVDASVFLYEWLKHAATEKMEAEL